MKFNYFLEYLLLSIYVLNLNLNVYTCTSVDTTSEYYYFLMHLMLYFSCKYV